LNRLRIAAVFAVGTINKASRLVSPEAAPHYTPLSSSQLFDHKAPLRQLSSYIATNYSNSLLVSVSTYSYGSIAKMSQQSDINLYTTQTPNGIKVSITLEELGYVPF